MDRQAIIAKIQNMMKLQESTDFEGEAAAAAQMIKKLCKQHGISVEEANNPVALDETFESFKKMNSAYALLLNAVAKYYDAMLYVKRDGINNYQIIGTEAQQIETKLYFEYLNDVMEREADKAYKAEKVIAFLHDKKVDRSFKTNFKKAYAQTIGERLVEMKKSEGDHAHKEAVQSALCRIRFNKTHSVSGARGAGAASGSGVGAGVSLQRQQGAGASRRSLVGAWLSRGFSCPLA